MSRVQWRTFGRIKDELVQQYGATWWASTAPVWFWTGVVVLPLSFGAILWDPTVVRFPLRRLWFWIAYIVIAIPLGSIIVVLSLADTFARTRHNRWIGRHFAWIAAALATMATVVMALGIAGPLIRRLG